MKIFVTGGTGFIGRHFIREALSSGHHLVATRRNASQPSPSENRALTWVEKPMDQLTDDDFSDCEALVHLAATGVSPQQATWEELFHWNVVVTLKTCMTALNAGLRRIVVAGSFAEYGLSGTRFEFIPPDAPLEPVIPYAASKAAAFLGLHALCVERSFHFVYPRIFSAFGDGQHPANFWPSLKHAALSGSDFPMTLGEQIRDFIPVEQVAKQLLKDTMRSDLKPGHPFAYNLASGKPQTLAEFASFWWAEFKATGKLRQGAIPYRPNEVMRFVPQVTSST